MDAIFTRRSVRKFTGQKVEKEKVEQILRAGFQAPTAGNQRGWEFYVIRDRAVLDAISKASPYGVPAANADIAIAICYSREGLQFPMMAEVDCAIATENMLLEIESLGLGGVMLGIWPFEDRVAKVTEILSLPEGHIPFTVIPFGYPVKKKAPEDRYDAAKVHEIG